MDVLEAGLPLLMGAPSREALAAFFDACFEHRGDSAAAASSSGAAGLGLPLESVTQAALAGIAVVRRAVYESSVLDTKEAVQATLPRSLDKRLSALIAGLVLERLPSWRDSAIDSRVSLPQLEHTAWRVDVLGAASEAAVVSEPTLTLSLRLREQPHWAGVPPGTRDLALTLPPAVLGSLLEGMRRIKDQLGAIAGAASAAS